MYKGGVCKFLFVLSDAKRRFQIDPAKMALTIREVEVDWSMRGNGLSNSIESFTHFLVNS